MIGFAGLSHLGLVTSAAIASRGIEIVGYDPDPSVVSAIQAGRLAISEPGLDDLLAGPRPRFTADASALAACELVYVALDVSTNDAGQSDLGPLLALIDRVWPLLRPDATLVVLSQVPPGFTRALNARRSTGGPAAVVYQVETLIFGDAVRRALEPERYILGCADPGAGIPEALRRGLRAFNECPILPMRYESAELAKIAINCFLVSSVSTTNMLAELCEGIGADWSEIAPALRLDARIGPKAYLGAGLGIGGGNLGRDLATVKRLSDRHGTDTRIIDAWRANSQYRRDWALRLLHSRILERQPGAAIALWGLAYKADTAFMMNSPAVALLEALPGRAIRAYDPAARIGPDMPALEQIGDPLAACRGADVLLVMTPWREFGHVPPPQIRKAMRGDVVIDPYRCLDARAVAAAGLQHFSLGSGQTPE